MIVSGARGVPPAVVRAATKHGLTVILDPHNSRRWRVEYGPEHSAFVTEATRGQR